MRVVLLEAVPLRVRHNRLRADRETVHLSCTLCHTTGRGPLHSLAP